MRLDSSHKHGNVSVRFGNLNKKYFSVDVEINVLNARNFNDAISCVIYKRCNFTKSQCACGFYVQKITNPSMCILFIDYPRECVRSCVELELHIYSAYVCLCLCTRPCCVRINRTEPLIENFSNLVYDVKVDYLLFFFLKKKKMIS